MLQVELEFSNAADPSICWFIQEADIEEKTSHTAAVEVDVLTE